jgi:prevent-host-death family protein
LNSVRQWVITMLNADFSLENDIVGITEARANFTALVDDVEREHAQKVIIRNGRAAAVLVNVADLQALQDRILAMELETAYKMALAEEKRGELLTLDTMVTNLGFDPDALRREVMEEEDGRE